jgi:hypothetical protein
MVFYEGQRRQMHFDNFCLQVLPAFAFIYFFLHDAPQRESTYLKINEVQGLKVVVRNLQVSLPDHVCYGT